MADFQSNPLRNLLLILLLAGCAQTSGGIDWHTWTRAMTISGKMRTERRPDDAPITRQTLIDNFRRIAFDLEKYPLGKEQPAKQQQAGPHLRKWHEPIRYEVVTIDEDDAEALRKIVPFMNRLVQITGLPIRRKSAQPIHDETAHLIILYGPDAVFAAFKDEVVRRDIDDSEREAMLRIATFIETWRLARSPCAGTFYETSLEESGPRPGAAIVAGIVLIKREIPPELFASCVEEELAQVMGLLNDDPSVRPSLFNDDQEFALLTEHDEYLLKILYDDRLEPGMTPEVAMPIVRRIVAELLPDS